MLPDWLDYSFSENAATAMFRGLRGLSANWGELIATAQTIMSIYQDELEPEAVERLYKEENALHLIAASRILDASSQSPAKLPPEDRQNLALAAAVAFGMYGNFPSAKAVIRRILPNYSPIPSSIAAIIATAAPNLLPQMLAYCDGKSPDKHYLELLGAFLYTGNTVEITTIRDALIECLLAAPSSFTSSLFRSCRLCLEHIFNLSVVRVLREHCDILPKAYLSRLVDKGVRVFLPPQYKAITQHRLPTNQENAIVALPTSTGKTLLGELCLIAALRQKPGIVCYLAPYVALGNQVWNSLREHLPQEYRVKRMLGGFKEEEALDPVNFMEVVVATPERLDALLRISPHLIPYLRCVVCDEAHGIQNDTRGIRLEGLLTRLRLLQNTGKQFRLILLSAVLSEYDKLKGWIGTPETGVVTDSWKPTARRLSFWKEDGKLVWYVGHDPIRQPGTTNESKIGELDLPWPERGFYLTKKSVRPEKKFIQEQQQKLLVRTNVAYLADVLSQSYGGTILCVCTTKDDTRRVAVALSKRFPLIEPLPKTITSAITSIETYHPFLLSLCELLKHGVAFHNATLPHKIRQLIENAINDGELIAVAATTTLAEGVNLPFRFTIIVDWLAWQGKPMSSLLFKNVAGRCGRAGVFTEGDTVLFDNPVGNEDYTNPYRRESIQKNLFLSKQPEDAELTSAIEELFDTPQREQRERRNALLAVLASQFMAAIPENKNVDNLENIFAISSFVAYRVGSDAQIRGVLTEIRDSLLEEEKGALARAASPLHLTLFGTEANKTGFSPESCRRIVEVLQEPLEYQGTLFGESHLDIIVSIASKFLRELGTLPEQTDNNLRKTLSSKRSDFCVKPEDFERLLRRWLMGDSQEDIFVALPYAQRSRKKPRIQEWRNGLVELSNWDADFDQFVEFISAVFEKFLPWLMRGCSYLSAFAGDWPVTIDWQQWAEMIEKGVDSKWAVEALNRDAPASRKAVAIMGRNWPPGYQTEIDPLSISFIRNDLAARQHIERLFQDAILKVNSPMSTDGHDLLNIRNWLWRQADLPVREISDS